MANFKLPDRKANAFYRVNADGERTYIELENLYCGYEPRAVFIIGNGPTIKEAPVEAINNSPIPVFGLNFATENTTGIRLDFWSAYDCLERYETETILNPRVIKFLPKWRETNFIHSAIVGAQIENAFFFELGYRNFENLFDLSSDRILDVNNTVPQAIDICFRLGFRKLYLIGLDNWIQPTREQIEFAAKEGVEYDGVFVKMSKKYHEQEYSDKLIDFAKELERKTGKSWDDVCHSLGLLKGEKTDHAKKLGDLKEKQSVSKEFATLANIDSHYWKCCQLYRQAACNMARNGVEIISCMKNSRWNFTVKNESPLEAITRHRPELVKLRIGLQLNIDQPGEGKRK